ncbi:MAG: QueT transporter family protein [Negativicoccus massiliensis]|uniref:QueT transporter family protein n=1 Tax=Negativicoccus succinicivorans TaxID=620903 RepID=UPI0026EB6995|nr:QueT transporter family protein [Negativicoccus succinicivorans]MDU4641469.1 QueT transporter family protein [Negativicoccus massiliensis]MBS5887923.1 QueT transporter family protein [Negativicoccus succinicivorans]MDU2417805.1 QueT transporter family protein [Negativicoccus succinicivorans]MDU3214513.1 QueT transporter family protein [Negativicoccus succinicivorans]MDU5027155.1 QueT transporter family protein [Negativicoccus succinicivorans]
MNTRMLVINAVLAAVYALLTVALAPFSYGPVQVRLSEVLTLLAFYQPKVVPGLILGCLLANLASPFGMIDIVVGTLATAIAVYGMRYMPNIWTASLLPVVSNGVLIGAELAYLGALEGESVGLTMLYIAAGEFVAVSVLGCVLIPLLWRNTAFRRLLQDL